MVESERTIIMPDPLDLERVRSYCAKATAGPWCHRQAGETRPAGHPLDWIADTADRSHHKIIIGRECLYGGTPDYAFIANARTDLPAAVEEIEALRAEVTSLSIELSTCRADNKHLRLVDGREDAEPVFLQNHELLQENRQFREAIAELRQQLRNEQDRK